MFQGESFTFQAKMSIWRKDGQEVSGQAEIPKKGNWYLVSLPKETADWIDFFGGGRNGGRKWRSIPVRLEVGSSVWETSIFRDAKNKTYILFIKKVIREAENLKLAQEFSITLTIR